MMHGPGEKWKRRMGGTIGKKRKDQEKNAKCFFFNWNTSPGLCKVTYSLKNALYSCLSLIYGDINKYCLFPPVEVPADGSKPLECRRTHFDVPGQYFSFRIISLEKWSVCPTFVRVCF